MIIQKQFTNIPVCLFGTKIKRRNIKTKMILQKTKYNYVVNLINLSTTENNFTINFTYLLRISDKESNKI